MDVRLIEFLYDSDAPEGSELTRVGERLVDRDATVSSKLEFDLVDGEWEDRYIDGDIVWMPVDALEVLALLPKPGGQAPLWEMRSLDGQLIAGAVARAWWVDEHVEDPSRSEEQIIFGEFPAEHLADPIPRPERSDDLAADLLLVMGMFVPQDPASTAEARADLLEFSPHLEAVVVSEREFTERLELHRRVEARVRQSSWSGRVLRSGPR